jgi:hypothetical protein
MISIFCWILSEVVDCSVAPDSRRLGNLEDGVGFNPFQCKGCRNEKAFSIPILHSTPFYIRPNTARRNLAHIPLFPIGGRDVLESETNKTQTEPAQIQAH